MRSILVRAAIPEGGAKNPSKGTSMKFLVLAADAQSGLVLGMRSRGDPQGHVGVDPLFVETLKKNEFSS